MLNVQIKGEGEITFCCGMPSGMLTPVHAHTHTHTHAHSFMDTQRDPEGGEKRKSFSLTLSLTEGVTEFSE